MKNKKVEIFLSTAVAAVGGALPNDDFYYNAD